MAQTSISARGHMPVNMLKPHLTDNKRMGIFPQRTNRHTHTSAMKHTIAVIDMGHAQSKSEIQNKVVEGITDLAGQFGAYNSHAEAEANCVFGGIVTRNALDTATSHDASFAGTHGGQVSYINTGKEKLNAGGLVCFEFPKHKNSRYFMANPNASELSPFDKFSDGQDVPPGKILIQTVPFRPEEKALIIKNIYNQGIAPDTEFRGTGLLFHEHEKHNHVLIQLAQLEAGLVRRVPSGDRARVGAQFRNDMGLNPGQIPNMDYETLVTNLYKGVNKGTGPGFFIPNKGAITRVSLRSKCAQRAEDLVFRKKNDNKRSRHKLVAEQRSLMTRFTVGIIHNLEKVRSRIIGKSMTTTAAGGLGDLLAR
jgi:hypothetical protein